MVQPIAPSDVFHLSESQVSSELEGQVVVLNAQTGSYYKLNGVASAVWREIDGQKSVANICENLRLKYKVDADRALAEVVQFISGLEENEIVGRV